MVGGVDDGVQLVGFQGSVDWVGNCIVEDQDVDLDVGVQYYVWGWNLGGVGEGGSVCYLI